MNADLVAFLERFRPDGYTTFVGIVPDGSTVAATFNGADPSKAANWIESQNRARGVYFTANPTPADLRRKPTKNDIVAIASLWADVDPRDSNGHQWTEERDRLLSLADELAALDCSPSFIVDSGNGIQPVWLLANGVEASPEYRAAAEALCARIEAALGAKGTHNVDRLLRVPGTRNLPNARKRQLGRGETQARLLHPTWQLYAWRDLEDLAAHLEDQPLEHAIPPSGNGPGSGPADPGDLDLPDEPPEPLDDATLLSRTREARDDWEQYAQDALDQQIDGDLLASLRAQAIEKLAGIQAEIDAINETLRAETSTLGIELPAPFEPEPALPDRDQGKPLVSTRWAWHEQTRALIARKRLSNGDAS